MFWNFSYIGELCKIRSNPLFYYLNFSFNLWNVLFLGAPIHHCVIDHVVDIWTNRGEVDFSLKVARNALPWGGSALLHLGRQGRAPSRGEGEEELLSGSVAAELGETPPRARRLGVHPVRVRNSLPDRRRPGAQPLWAVSELPWEGASPSGRSATPDPRLVQEGAMPKAVPERPTGPTGPTGGPREVPAVAWYAPPAATPGWSENAPSAHCFPAEGFGIAPLTVSRKPCLLPGEARGGLRP